MDGDTNMAAISLFGDTNMAAVELKTTYTAEQSFELSFSVDIPLFSYFLISFYIAD